MILKLQYLSLKWQLHLTVLLNEIKRNCFLSQDIKVFPAALKRRFSYRDFFFYFIFTNRLKLLAQSKKTGKHKQLVSIKVGDINIAILYECNLNN